MPRGTRGGGSIGGGSRGGGSRGGRSFGGSRGSSSFGGSRGSRSFGGSRIGHSSGYRPSYRSRSHYHRRPGFRTHYRPWYSRRRHYGGYRTGRRWYGWGGGSDIGQIIGCLLCSIIFVPILLAFSGVFFYDSGSSIMPIIIIGVIGVVIIMGLAATNSGEETGSNYIPVSNDASLNDQPRSSTVAPTRTTYSTPTANTTTYDRKPAVVRQEPQRVTRVPQTDYYGIPSEKVKKSDDLVAKSYDVCPNCGSLTEPEDFFCTNCGTKLK